MHTDLFGQDTTISSRDALESWNACLSAFMAHGATTPTHLGNTLEKDPTFALGHAVKGMFYLLLGRAELIDIAREAYGLAIDPAF